MSHSRSSPSANCVKQPDGSEICGVDGRTRATASIIETGKAKPLNENFIAS